MVLKLILSSNTRPQVNWRHQRQFTVSATPSCRGTLTIKVGNCYKNSLAFHNNFTWYLPSHNRYPEYFWSLTWQRNDWRFITGRFCFQSNFWSTFHGAVECMTCTIIVRYPHSICDQFLTIATLKTCFEKMCISNVFVQQFVCWYVVYNYNLQ